MSARERESASERESERERENERKGGRESQTVEEALDDGIFKLYRRI